MIIFKGFQALENFYIKFQDFPYFSWICTNPVCLTVMIWVPLVNTQTHTDRQTDRF